MVNLDRRVEVPTLSWNKAKQEIRHFRTFDDVHQKPIISRIGYTKNLSGSGQLTESNFSSLIATVKKATEGKFDKIILIDLRLESHGFINGLPVEWKTQNSDYNLGKKIEDIKASEKALLLEIKSKKTLTVQNEKSTEENEKEQDDKEKSEKEVQVQSVATEEEVAVAYGLEYVRLATLDHYRPNDNLVDDFVKLIRNNPNSWLHLHCRAGQGRTTTFMCMYDMFYNAKSLDFEEIVERQRAIDGQDLFKHHKKPMDERKSKFSEERLEFLIKFYDYCKNSDPSAISWQEWLKAQK